MINQDELIKIVKENKLVKYDQLNIIIQDAEAQKKPIADILESMIDQEALAKAKAKFYKMSYSNISELAIREDVLHIISSEVAENYKIICFNKEDNKIKVGMIDPDNFKAIEAVDFLAKEGGLQVKYYLISKQGFQAAFTQYKSLTKELSSALKTRAADEEEGGVIAIKERGKVEPDEITKSAPVVKIVSVIIRHAVEGRASDIHIEPLPKESRVRYRIDGILHTSLVLPKSVHASIVARIKVMANLKLDETRIPQDGRIRLLINDKEIDFRVSILPVVGAEKVVMRILDTTKGAPKLEELGFEGQQLETIHNSIKKTEGIVLITGPTGSGKSTTLFSVLDMVNKEGVNIATLEDPVEYKMKGVSQSQIKPDIGYTFASGLRSFLRQDPDIIMVGEIRDEETAELAIHAALTGHLVFSTLHTTDALGAIPRLIDMKVESFLLGSTLVAVVAQRLARKICSHCKEEVKMPEKYLQEIKKDINEITVEYIRTIIKDFDINKLVFHKGKGCSRCGNTGYKGRVALSEVLEINNMLEEKIIEGKKYLNIKVVGESQKFITVKQDGIIKVLQGLTTMEDVLRVMRD